MQKKYLTFLIFLITIVFTNKAFASSLYFVPTPGAEASIISYDVMIDPQGETINAISGKLPIPNNLLITQSVSTIDSVVLNWLTAPNESTKITQGNQEIISFEGIIPGGFKGIMGPYYKGLKAGKLFTIILKPIKKGEATLSLNDVTVLLNDGLGSKDKVETTPATFSITDQELSHKDTTVNKNKVEVKTDTMYAFIDKNETVANGQWFLSFQEDSTRKDVDYYEIAESYDSNPRNIFFFNWHTQTSPYILSDQERKHFIHIKTFYKDGSFSYTTMQPVEKPQAFSYIYIILISSGILLILAFLYLFQNHANKKLIKKFKK